MAEICEVSRVHPRGLPDLEQMEGADMEPGDVVVEGSLLGEESCPRFGALVFAAHKPSRPNH